MAAAPVAAPGARPFVVREQVTPKSSFVIKETGLALLSSLVSALQVPKGATSADHPTVGVYHAVAELLHQLKPAQLFPDWSPPTHAPESAVPVSKKNVSAASQKSDGMAAASALGSGSTMWQSKANPDDEKSWWMVRFTSDVEVSSLSLAVENARAAEKVEVQSRVGNSGPWTTLFTVPGASLVSGPGKSPARRLELPEVTKATWVRINFEGFSELNKSKQHSLAVFEAATFVEKPFIGPKDVIADIETWLAAGATCSSDVVRLPALRGLMRLALVSGSLRSVLRLAAVLSDDSAGYGSTSGASASGDTLSAAKDFLGSMDAQFDEVCTNLAGGGGGGLVNLRSATFDELRGASIAEDPLTVKSDSGAGLAVLSVGFSTGKASWDCKIITDSRGGECTAFGVSKKPIEFSSYDHSACLWMYRAYNGQLYKNGVAGSSKTKFHPDDIIHFDLDMDAGTLSASVNGVQQGVLFDNLAGETIYPAIAFYSSGRKSTLMNLEASGAEGKHCFALDDGAKDLPGVRGVGDDLGVDSKKISVDGEAYSLCLSVLPPAESEVTAEFDVVGKDAEPGTVYDTFDAMVALNDDIGDARTDAPVVFEVLGDGESLWTSPPVSTAKDVHKVQLKIAGVSKLALKVSCAGPNTNAHAIWVDPACRSAPWVWTRREASVGGEASDYNGVVANLLTIAQLYSREAMRSMRTAAPVEAGGTALPLETPFAVQADGSTFKVAQQLLEELVGQVEQESSAAKIVALLQVVKTNLRRLSVSGLNPRAAGIRFRGDASAGDSKADDGERESKDEGDGTLDGLHHLLLKLSGEPGKPAPVGIPPLVSQEAAEVLDIGLELFYPTPAARHELLSGLVSTGGMVEVHFRWPAPGAEPGEQDYRYERATLLLQSRCRTLGWRCEIVSSFGVSLHTLIELPSDSPATSFLSAGLAEIMTNAGFGQWEFPLGCTDPEIKLKIERHRGFDRSERFVTEPGLGWVRLFPRGVGTFEDVRDDVEAFLKVESAKTAEKATTKAD